jgi:hypothetical protein
MTTTLDWIRDSSFNIQLILATDLLIKDTIAPLHMYEVIENASNDTFFEEP